MTVNRSCIILNLPDMTNSYWLWKVVIFWFCVTYHLHFAGVYGHHDDKCLTLDGREGRCVAKRYCREAANKILASCGDDIVCCTIQTVYRSTQPTPSNGTSVPGSTVATTTKAPILPERPFIWQPPRTTNDDQRPGKPTQPPDRPTAEPIRPTRHSPSDGTKPSRKPKPPTIIPHPDFNPQNPSRLPHPQPEIPAGVHGIASPPIADKCLTSDGREGLCVTRQFCSETNNEFLVKCSDDIYCCANQPTYRYTQPSPPTRTNAPPTTEATTTKAPTHSERPKQEPPYDRNPPRRTYNDQRSGKPTQPSGQPTTETVKPSHHPSNEGTKPPRRLKPPTKSPHPNVKPPNPWELPHPPPQITGCGQKNPERKIRAYIVGGQDANEHWPWMVAIHVSRNGFFPRFTCGGSLITSRHVLTAAHCFDSRERGKDMYGVLIGTSNITTHPKGPVASSSGEFIDVLNIRIHDQYATGVHYYDIALLTLESRVPLSELVSPVCLPSPEDLTAVTSYMNVTVTGWGHTTYGGSESDFLQEVDLQILPFRFCQLSFEEFRSQGLSQGITTDMLCAGFPKGGLDACKGDSGGPLVMQNEGRWIQVGIVAFGVQCGAENYPGVYTRVSAYVQWITRILSEYQYII